MTKREMIKALMFIQESLIHVHEVLAKVDDRVEQLRNVLEDTRKSEQPDKNRTVRKRGIRK
jgi:hypothetical protein